MTVAVSYNIGMQFLDLCKPCGHHHRNQSQQFMGADNCVSHVFISIGIWIGGDVSNREKYVDDRKNNQTTRHGVM